MTDIYQSAEGTVTLDPEPIPYCEVKAITVFTREISVPVKWRYDTGEQGISYTPFKAEVPVWLEAPLVCNGYQFMYWIDPDGNRIASTLIRAEKKGTYTAYYTLYLLGFMPLDLLWWILGFILFITLMVTLVRAIARREKK